MFGNEGPKYIWLFKGRIQLWGDLSLSFDIGSKTESDDKYKLGEKKAVTNCKQLLTLLYVDKEFQLKEIPCMVLLVIKPTLSEHWWILVKRNS